MGTSDTKVAQYYLLFESNRRTPYNVNKDDEKTTTTFSFENPGVEMTPLGRAKLVSVSSETASSVGTLSKEEKLKLIDNKGKTQAMAESIAEVFGIEPKCIEVGYSRLTKYGIIIP